MTFDGRAFASDVLAMAGAENVFADRPRRYPLAADLANAASLSNDRVGDRDTRYPRVTLAEVEARAPEIVLLPDEPHRFVEADRDELQKLAIPAAREGRIDFIDGKELFWYGTRVGRALDRIAKRFTSKTSR
jgi:ABC-type Fe3+-hydroxamate transport system substrate-binding protein